MNKYILTILAGAALSAATVSCNDNGGTTGTYQYVYPAAVTGFSFLEDDDICTGLDSVFFSIDQLGLQIYNADSLPVGTKINKLVPKVTAEGASLIEFHVPRTGKADTVINYNQDNKDSIDFSGGNVRMRVIALDGVASVMYTIKVNVHTTIPDTLVWSRMERSTLPTSFGGVVAQRTTMSGDTYYCLTEYDNKYCVARATDPAATWEYATPGFNFTPNLDSFNGADDALYILDATGMLHRSTDGGVTWSATGQTWNHVIGAYGKKLLGVRKAGNTWKHATYPVSAETEIAADFPVSGTSQTILREFEMSNDPQLMMMGGRKADGSVSSDVWGYDGNTWTCLKKRAIPLQLENLTMTPYFTVKTNRNTWETKTGAVVMAWNGNRQDGTPNDTVYVSGDFGMHWTIADSIMQPPTSVPARTRAQAFTHSTTMHTGQSVRAMAAAHGTALLEWHPVKWLTPAAPGDVTTCATAPITEWDCPFIYMFGGVDQQGHTMNTLFRGVITRFTYKPLQ